MIDIFDVFGINTVQIADVAFRDARMDSDITIVAVYIQKIAAIITNVIIMSDEFETFAGTMSEGYFFIIGVYFFGTEETEFEGIGIHFRV
jgi:hypothetical protein